MFVRTLRLCSWCRFTQETVAFENFYKLIKYNNGSRDTQEKVAFENFSLFTAHPKTVIDNNGQTHGILACSIPTSCHTFCYEALSCPRGGLA